MEITVFDDIRVFQRRAEPVLGQREAEFNFLVGLLAALADSGWQGRYDAPPLLALVEDQERAVGLVVRTPPHNLLLTDLPAAAMGALTAWLRQRQINPPGVMGPKAAAEAFATEWSRQTGRTARLAHGLGNHQLRRVIPPPPPPGQMRQATAERFDLLVSWAEAFNRDVHVGTPAHPGPMIQRHLDRGGLFLWHDGGPVAMAGCGQPTPNGIRIYLVYTPPEHRRRGYATALVAQLSQRLLDAGRQFCFLFTDLANPTANRIYRKIGYEGVCDYAEYRFASLSVPSRRHPGTCT